MLFLRAVRFPAKLSVLPHPHCSLSRSSLIHSHSFIAWKLAQRKITDFFGAPKVAPKAAPVQAAAPAKAQMCIDFFFKPAASTPTDSSESRFKYLYEREEAERKKREEKERLEAEQRRREEEELRRKLLAERKAERRRQQLINKRKRELDQARRWLDEERKRIGRLIVPELGLFLGNRLAARNAEWLFDTVDLVLNVTHDVPLYFVDGRAVELDDDEQDDLDTLAADAEPKDQDHETSGDGDGDGDGDGEDDDTKDKVDHEQQQEQQRDVVDTPADAMESDTSANVDATITAETAPDSLQPDASESPSAIDDATTLDNESTGQGIDAATLLVDVDDDDTNEDDDGKTEAELELELQLEPVPELVVEEADVNAYKRRRASMQYARLKVHDTRDDILPIDDAMALLDQAFGSSSSSDGERPSVLVHCREGLSRSPSIVIAYLMYRLKYSLLDAYQRVLERNLNRLRINDGFKKQLLDYEQRLFPDRPTSIEFLHARALRSSSTNIRPSAAATATATATATTRRTRASAAALPSIDDGNPAAVPASAESKPKDESSEAADEAAMEVVA